MYFENEVVKDLLKLYRRVWALSHAMSLMGWDLETYMPAEGVEERSIAHAELSLMVQELLLRKEFLEVLEKASKQESLNDYEEGVVRILEREVRIAKALPPRLVEELAKVTQEARVAWKVAREKNDFEVFRHYLEKIVDLTREKANYLGFKEHPYDALLDLYEEGMTTRDVDTMFTYLEPRIRKVLDKVLSEGRYSVDHPLEKEKYLREEAEKFNLAILEAFGFPLGKRARLDVSAHPFTMNIGVRDVRITTRYEGYDFKRTLFSVIHEFGHALYELQIDEGLRYTPVGSGVSLGIHESQSRFWENVIGRSRAFVNAFIDLIRLVGPARNRDPEDIYVYFNTVKPSLIRVDADEVTYNLHIILRFKLEKLMITGEVKVAELPELWNHEIENLLGIKPKNYSEGVLQDIHWSMGAIGYFPTYTLGTLLSSQIAHHMDRDLKGLYTYVINKDFQRIKDYLREKIHKWGSVYPPKKLLLKSFSETYNPEYFVRYLEEKFSS
ncbi:MAG: carboxypeptidase M32 [Desulfurococcaceae archaeon TW002]